MLKTNKQKTPVLYFWKYICPLIDLEQSGYNLIASVE